MALKSRKTIRPRVKRAKKKSDPLLQLELASPILREIWGVIYVALGALTWLSLNQNLGILGELWVSVLKPIFGVGLSFVPVLLLAMGVSVFLSKKVEWGLTRFLGLFMMASALLGYAHMQVPLVESWDQAEQGLHGGYIGFVSSFLFQLGFGAQGAWILLTATLVIGILLTFQWSLADLLRAGLPSKAQVKRGVEALTPELTLKDIPRLDDEELAHSVKIVQALQAREEKEDEDEDASEGPLTIKEVSAEEIAQRLQKVKREEKEKESVPEGELVWVNEKESSPKEKWVYPTLDLLKNQKENFAIKPNQLRIQAAMIKDKLEQFGIAVSMQEIHVGPTVIQYTLKPADGVKLSKITALKNDLALALAAPAIRIEAPIPGKSLVGIEIPNEVRATVFQREIMETDTYRKEGSRLKLALGRNVSGEPVIADLAKMPHLLIAGATGAGKSVGMNSFLISLLYNNSPQELRLIMIDPKQVELTPYNGLPHLLTPVITDPEKAATSLRWAVAEMNRRYKLCAEVGARNLEEYNKGRDAEERMSYIVIVIDELADLMMQAQKEVEASICRIAQMARAVGMHLIIATQRPSVDVITGLIKANIPARIAFTVASSIDSRTILDTVGAEDLLGRGDMLYLSGTMGKPIRVQGIYLSTEEVEKVTRKLKLTLAPDSHSYLEDITSKETMKTSVQGMPDISDSPQSDDELMALALECIKKNPKAASTSSLQRYLKIGYSRAARIVDLLEERGYIGSAQGSKPRSVLIDFSEEED